MTTQERLTVQGPEDILSYIPHALGYWPRDSLVCITMAGKSVGATLRLDLPDKKDQASRRYYAEQVCDYLSADDQADGALLAVFSSRSWRRSGPAPFRQLLGTVAAALEDAGLPVRDAWYLGLRHWRNYYCQDVTCCPWPGHPIEQITGSTLNAELVYRGSSYAADSADAVAAGMPAPDGDLAALIGAAAQQYASALHGDWRADDQFAATLGVWEAAVRHPPAADRPPLDPETLGFLLASLDCMAVRDSVLVLASVGLPAALEGARRCGLLGQNAGTVQVPAAMPRYGADEQQELPVADFGEVLMGASAAPPQWDRLERLQQVLIQLAGGSLPGPQAAALTMLGWIEWCRGRGSHADALLQRALRCAPDYRLAVLMRELLMRGHVCAWARDRTTAWQKGQQGAA